MPLNGSPSLERGPVTALTLADQPTSASASVDSKVDTPAAETGRPPSIGISSLRTGILISIFCFAQFIEQVHLSAYSTVR